MHFSLATKTPETKRTDAIIVAGKEVGHVDENTDSVGSRFHAVIDLRLCGLHSYSLVGSLAQGHGDSVEEAISDAIVASKRDAEAYLSVLAGVAAQMGVA